LRRNNFLKSCEKYTRGSKINSIQDEKRMENLRVVHSKNRKFLENEMNYFLNREV
jgi:hypothetical protein